MQMMKNKKGITLISLVITIIVLIIILSITLNYGLSEIHEATNKKIEIELGTIQQAIMQRYALVQSKNQLGIKADPISVDKLIDQDVNRPKDFVGKRLANSKSIENYGFSGISFVQNYSSGENDMSYEQYYYLIDENDMKELGVEKGDNGENPEEPSKTRSYIVNYLTGEIFDIYNKKYYKTGSQDGDLIYKQPTDVNVKNQNYVFNDD